MKYSFSFFTFVTCIILSTVAFATDSPSHKSDAGIELIAKLIGNDDNPLSGFELTVLKVKNKVEVKTEMIGGKIVGPSGKSDKNGTLIITIPKGFLTAGDDFTFGTAFSMLTKNGSPAVFTFPSKIKNNKVLLGDVHWN
jgi:hypothetical protein